MERTEQSNDEQFRLWNGPAGRAWVEMQELLDRMFMPLEHMLVESVAALGGGRVLDVGCGTGSTTLAVARTLGDKVRCTGVDISEPMIVRARQRAQEAGDPVRFVVADAQTHVFEPAGFDVMVSRFGMMFFEDVVRAFTNLHRAASPGAALRMLAWRHAAENPFMTAAERAAAPLLPDLPARRTDGPGQFAFADRDRVAAILDDSGWTDIGLQPVDVVCTLPRPDIGRYIQWMGPVGVMLQKMDEAAREPVVRAARAAFEPFVHGDEIRFTAACWMISARAA